MAIPYTKKMMIERVRRHIANGFPNDEFTIYPNEVLLYIDASIAANLVGNMYASAKITGAMATPEAYIVTTQLSSLIKNESTGEWYATLPQTPLSLSLGYSIPNAYIGDPTNGKSQPIWLIKNKRAAYRDYMPKPSGTSARVVGNKIFIKAKDNTPLSNLDVFVDMVSTRTNDINEVIALPDDAIESVFKNVVNNCLQRMGLQTDVVKDHANVGSAAIK